MTRQMIAALVFVLFLSVVFFGFAVRQLYIELSAPPTADKEPIPLPVTPSSSQTEKEVQLDPWGRREPWQDLPRVKPNPHDETPKEERKPAQPRRLERRSRPAPVA